MPSKPNAYELHRYLSYHRKPGDYLYAVVDAAKDYRLAMASRDILGEPLRPLFTNVPHFMERVGPYLARINCTNRYPEYMQLWADRMGDNAGIFIVSPAWPKPLRTHLRSIFKVFDENKNMFYFRFYDPRVLRAYLPTCTLKECREFFGPMRSILAEGPALPLMRQYQVGQSAIHLEEIDVQALVHTLDEAEAGAPV